MVKSMTGFGKAVGFYGNKAITVEIKSINSKYFDLSLKIPQQINELEFEIRNLLQQKLERGKVYCLISIEYIDDDIAIQINEEVLKKYFEKIKKIETALGIKKSDDYLSVLLRMPEAFKSNTSSSDPEELEVVKKFVCEAVHQLNRFRISEGADLQKDLLSRVKIIERHLKSIEPHESGRIEKVKIRLKTELDGLKIDAIDNNRFEQELIYHIEKLDFTEEKVRLRSHLDFFIEAIQEDTSNGRKLNFITQEMGREINTIGSKASDAAIQRIVVDMKDELEKIKEQLLNLL